MDKNTEELNRLMQKLQTGDYTGFRTMLPGGIAVNSPSYLVEKIVDTLGDNPPAGFLEKLKEAEEAAHLREARNIWKLLQSDADALAGPSAADFLNARLHRELAVIEKDVSVLDESKIKSAEQMEEEIKQAALRHKHRPAFTATHKPPLETPDTLLDQSNDRNRHPDARSAAAADTPADARAIPIWLGF